MISHRKIGGIHFFSIGRLCFSFCIKTHTTTGNKEIRASLKRRPKLPNVTDHDRKIVHELFG